MTTKTKTRTKKRRQNLSAIQPMVAGIDIGSTQHWVAGPPRRGEPNVKTFGTTTPELAELVAWLKAQRVTSAAMESTSVYWIPLHEMLEAEGIQPVLVNARQLHNVPGRAKTDFKDCQWLQLLHSRGLLRGSFRPAESIAKLRALQRQMSNLVAERTKSVQWIQKALDQMNVQVHHAVTDITGKTGMTIVRAIVAGERRPMHLAMHRDPRCHRSVEEIARCLSGNWREEHLFNLTTSVELFDYLDKMVTTYEQRLLAELEALQPPERREQAVPPHPNRNKRAMLRTRGDEALRSTLWRVLGADLTRIDGIGAGTAQTIVTEIGPDVSAFPTEGHFVSWLRLCPHTARSGGQRVFKRKAVGATRVASVLQMAASSLKFSKTALGAAYRRIARHKGAGVAVFATARKLAQLVYRMLRYGQQYVDVGEAEYELRFRDRRVTSLKEMARSLGFSLQEDPTLAA